MNAAGEPALLRPLSLGEIFDRALTLYVRNFALFALIALAVVVPLAVMQYFVGLHANAQFAQILAQIQHPGKGAPQASALDGLAFVDIALAVLLNAFAVVAIGIAVGGLYLHRPADWRASYALTLRRSGAVLLTLFCAIATIAALIFAGAIAMSLAIVASVMLLRGGPAPGTIAIVIASILAIAWIVAMLLCNLAFAFAFDAVGIEEMSAGAAIAAGFARIFNRSELLRAVLMCLALVVVYFGLMIVSLSLAGVLEALKLHLLYVVVSAAISLVSTGLLGVLQAVYYFDVRVRREGLDMRAQMDELHPVTAP